MSEWTKALSNRRNQRLIAILVVAIVGALGRGCPDGEESRSDSAPRVENHTQSAPTNAGTAIESLFRDERSGVVVEVAGEIERNLADDLEGSRHQKFILRLASGHTVLVSHNIDLAPKIPTERGDRVEIRGQYEWNERGGVLHWTHHDPQGRRPGGWIRHRGQDYR